MTAYQIEWNKLHTHLNRLPVALFFNQSSVAAANFSRLAEALEIPAEDLDRLYAI